MWILELHQRRPAEAAEAMRQWLDMARGQPERLAALQCLHESLAKHEVKGGWLAGWLAGWQGWMLVWEEELCFAAR